ncbi:alanyl-tRNA editing protein Aarsd1 [Elysia marginata]|uniref:Alanyl-tRNA editing protein Aarsd1 n=1 Tax=Elysia marginata TaxID=1093978 RepID=A0AAV4JBV2_9GAST|nr:alanyl-tRNA editing protein Aarsd1 [Elysia marginata]
MSFMCQKNSYMREFNSKVKSCKPASTTILEDGKKTKVKGYEVILEDTILFPEGGGQVNNIPVLKITRSWEDAVHFLPSEIPEGTEVSMKVDWQRRFDHMQQHTAQHLITAIVDHKFGYQTTSWNLGTDIMTIELGTPSLSSSQMTEVEETVNECIRKQLTVIPTLYPDKDDPELQKFRGLGLPADHVGSVRVVTIDGIDSALCCGTHISNLSHIQAIKLLGTEKIRKTNTNLLVLAGNRLLRYAGRSFDREKQLAAILKGPAEKQCELAEKAVKGMKNFQKVCNAQLKELAALEVSLFKQANSKDTVFIKHRKDGDNDYISVLLSELADESLPKLITVGEDKEGGMFVVAGPAQLVKDLGPRICELFEGKGAPNKGNMFRGKASKLTNRAAADKMMRECVSNTHGGGDSGEGTAAEATVDKP